MIYEVINPSDPVTLEHDDLEVAQAACLLLGRGAYGLEDEKGEEVLPLLLFGADDWMKERDFDLSGILSSKRVEVAACLRSAICCSPRERKALLAATGGEPERIQAYNDEKRSSLNDICGRAHDLAVATAGGWSDVPEGSDEHGG